ncbi:MAG: hypothetical protein WDO69_18140 [Pseudomonadota bacterium]
MTKSNLLMLSALSLLVAAGAAGGCGSTKQVWVPDPEETAGSSAGKAGSVSSAGESSMAGEPATEAGSGGAEEEGGEAGAPAGGTAGTGGIAGTGGTAGSSGSAGKGGTAGSGGTSGSSGSGGSAGKAGGGGTFGTAGTSGAAGSGGSAGKAGSGGTSGSGGTAGSAGKAGAGGTSGSAGSGGATVLFTPASTSCTSVAGVGTTGNIDTLFSVCRNCHSQPPQNSAPVSLVTYAQIKVEADNITTKLTGNLMPPSGSGYTISGPNKAAILAWVGAGAVGVPYTNGICP